MVEFDLKAKFADKTTIELLLIAENQGGEYTLKACQMARTLLAERWGVSMQLRDIWQQEIERLSSLSKRCHLCGSDEVSYNRQFFFCKPEGTKVEWLSLIGNVITLPLLGVGGISLKNQYQCVKLTLNLCSQCKKKRAKKSLFGGVEVCLYVRDYYQHPLYELYGALGFTELKFEEDFV